MGDFLHFFAIRILYLHFVFCIFVFSYFCIFSIFHFQIFRFSGFSGNDGAHSGAVNSNRPRCVRPSQSSSSSSKVYSDNGNGTGQCTHCRGGAESVLTLSSTVISVGLHRLGANLTRRKGKYTSASPRGTCLPSRQICIGVALGDPIQTPLQC